MDARSDTPDIDWSPLGEIQVKDSVVAMITRVRRDIDNNAWPLSRELDGKNGVFVADLRDAHGALIDQAVP